MYKILKNTIEMDDYSIQRLSSRVSQYLWYKLWGNTRQGVLPTGYTQVDYIESTGTQYIDTEVIANNNSRLFVDFQLTKIDTSRGIAGQFFTNNKRFQIYQSGTLNTITLGIGDANATVPSSLDRYKITLDAINLKAYVNNEDVSSSSYTRNISGNNSIYLFSSNQVSLTCSSMKLYNSKIWNNDVLVRDFIPCYRNSDNEVGLYDLVNNVFYTNQGTGSFTYGSVAPTPSTPVEVKGVGERTENLWNYTIEQGGWSASSGTIPTPFEPGSTNYLIRCRVPYMIPIPSNTMSLTCPSDIKINFVWVDVNGVSMGGTGWQQSGSTVTVPENATTLTFILAKVDDSNCSPNDFQNIMLNSGSTALPYEPYGYKIQLDCDSEIKNIYLNEPLHKINDYADILSYSEHNVVRKIKKLVLTGQENWRKWQSTTIYYMPISDYMLADGDITQICTHYQPYAQTTVSASVPDGYCVFRSVDDANKRILINDSDCATADEFKAYLAAQYANGTPVTIWYVLETPETEQIKAPDILANKYTSITVDTEVQPSQVDFSTKGKKVPQPSRETVRKLNSINTANQVNAINSIDMLNQSEELMKSEVEPSDNLIEESKEELEEPSEKEQTKEVEPIEKKEIEVEPIEKTDEKEITKK